MVRKKNSNLIWVILIALIILNNNQDTGTQSAVSLATDTVNNIGLGYFQSKGVMTIEQKFSQTPNLQALYNLEQSYDLGDRITADSYQRYTGGCDGTVRNVIEVYNAQVTGQSLSTYIGGDSKVISNPRTNIAYFTTMEFLIPTNEEPGTWSISAYLLCDDPISVVSRDVDGSLADERNFQVLDPDDVAPVCTEQEYSSCFRGNVHWYDSCGDVEEIRFECGAGQLCAEGRCSTISSCERNSFIKCDNDNLYWYDSCNKKGALREICEFSCVDGAGTCIKPPATEIPSGSDSGTENRGDQSSDVGVCTITSVPKGTMRKDGILKTPINKLPYSFGKGKTTSCYGPPTSVDGEGCELDLKLCSNSGCSDVMKQLDHLQEYQCGGQIIDDPDNEETTSHLAEDKQNSVELSDIPKLTTKDLTGSLCKTNSMCKSDANCRPLSYLIENDILSEKEAKGKLSTHKRIITDVVGVTGGALGAGALAFGGVCAALTGPGAPIAFPICTGLVTVGGAIIGGTLGEVTNELLQGIGEGDTKSVGYCVLEESDDAGEAECGNMIKFFSFGQDFAGDECTTGFLFMILTFIAIISVIPK